MEKYENFNTPPSPEYEMYTAEYISALFTLFHPCGYPTSNPSSSYIPTYKTQASQSEASLRARQNAVRSLFHQVYAQNFSTDVLRNLPRQRRLGRTCIETHKRRLNSRPPDYWELNRRRPSVIRRSIKSGTKCSSPREAVLESNFENDHEMKIEPVTPNYPQSDGSVIHKDPQLSPKDSQKISPIIPNYPQSEVSVIPKDSRLSTNDPQIIHKVPQREHQKSPIIQNATPFTPKYSNTVSSEHSDSTRFNTKISSDSSVTYEGPRMSIDANSVAKETRIKSITTIRKSDNGKLLQPQNTPCVRYVGPCVRIESNTVEQSDLTKPNATIMPPDYSNRVNPDHGNPIQIENSQRRDPLSIEPTTNTIEHSKFTIPRTSAKNTNTAMPDLRDLTQMENPQRCDPLSIEPTTNTIEHPKITIPRTSAKTSKTAKLDLGSKDKKYKYCCFHCKKRFRWFSHWQAHERIHTGVRPYKCNQCDRCFTRGDGLQAHMVIHSIKKPHKCQTCSKLFARKSLLERHIVEHTGIIPYKCEVCQDELLDPETIQGHLARHEQQTKFTCQYCKKCFVNGRKLVRHIRAHTGEKPFPCSQCKMKFSKKSALIIHHRVHSGDKPFCCPDCGKCFSISGNLRRHLLIHTGERPYPCTECKSRFNNKSHLARHMASQHANQ